MINTSVNVVVSDLKKTRERYWQTGDEMRSIEKNAWRKFKDYHEHSKLVDRVHEIIYNEFGRNQDLKHHWDELWLTTKQIAAMTNHYESTFYNSNRSNTQGLPFATGNTHFDNVLCKLVLFRFE